MKYLAICIPNYNRLDKLERLLLASVKQITRYSLEDLVEICVSDDCSAEDPIELVRKIQIQNPNVSIRYRRNQVNMGMDHNFLNSVLLSDSYYCWIIGNDDLPVEAGIKAAVEKLMEKGETIDLLVTPFNVIDNNSKIMTSVYPINSKEEIEFNTRKVEEYNELLWKIQHNSGLFGFLSNVIFKKENWCKFKEQFSNKMDTIFIQMYMNIQLLKEGAIYLYSPMRIIDNYADESVNESAKRICDILLGLDGVIEFFYDGDIKKYLKRVIVDAFISGMVWSIPDNSEYKERIRCIESEKNKIYENYFLTPDKREEFLKNKNIILYGAGNYGKKALMTLIAYDANILAVVDSDIKKQGEMFGNHTIQFSGGIKSLYTLGQTYVVVANHDHLVEIIKDLLSQKIDRLLIIT